MTTPDQALTRECQHLRMDYRSSWCCGQCGTKFIPETDIAALRAMVEALEEALNTPEILDFAKAVNIEAAHQRERWGTDHDDGKTDADWFWLIGYLTGKALHLPDKRLHHLITAAAALANWHLYTVGKTNTRPGIEPPEQQLAALNSVMPIVPDYVILNSQLQARVAELEQQLARDHQREQEAAP